MEKREPSYTVFGNVNWAATLETVWRFLKKLKIELPHDLAIPLLGIYPKEMKTLTQKYNLHTRVHCRMIYNSHDMKTT